MAHAVTSPQVKLIKVPMVMYSASARFSRSFSSPKRKMDFAAIRNVEAKDRLETESTRGQA